MPLSRGQFQELRNQGLSVDQIISFERGDKPEDLSRQKARFSLCLSRQKRKNGLCLSREKIKISLCLS